MQKKKGISLIVLVITIIVMIVLAGAIILSLNNAGIIEKANEAVKSTDEATIKELAQMAWAEAYADGVRSLEDLPDGTKGFKSRIKESLAKNNLNTEDYGMVVTDKGIEIAKGWLQKGTTVTKGNTTINVGELVAYDETKGGTVTVDKNVTWKVLGAENGELLIMSTDNVVDGYILGDPGKTGNVELAKDAVVNGISNLNTICIAYGKGTDAISARSITVEDVNRVTGYNPNEAAFNKGQLDEYGNEVTYTWNGSTTPYYSASNGLQGTLTDEHNGNFIYYNGKEAITSTNYGITAEKPKVITTIKSKSYWYYGTTLTISSKDAIKGLAKDSEAYKLLFRDSINSKDDRYWLASLTITTETNCAYYGLRCIYSGIIGGSGILISNGTTYGNDFGVRAVVSLGTDIVFTGTSAEGLTF